MNLFKCVTFAALFFTFSLAAAGAAFSDISGHEYEESIEFLAEEKIVNGYFDGTYKPDSYINRAEFLKILIEAQIVNYEFLGFLEAFNVDYYIGKTWFKDVPADAWYTKYVSAAKDWGWVLGYNDGKYFKPTQNVNFVESLKMMFTIFQIGPLKEISPWYKIFVDYASDQNWIPLSIGSFGENISRGEMADMVARLFKWKAGKLDIFLGEKADLVVTYDTLKNGKPPTAKDYTGDCPKGALLYRDVLLGYEFCYHEGGEIFLVNLNEPSKIEIYSDDDHGPDKSGGYFSISEVLDGEIDTYLKLWTDQGVKISNKKSLNNDVGIEGLTYDYNVSSYQSSQYSYNVLFMDEDNKKVFNLIFPDATEDDKEFLKMIEKTFKFI